MRHLTKHRKTNKSFKNSLTKTRKNTTNTFFLHLKPDLVFYYNTAPAYTTSVYNQLSPTITKENHYAAITSTKNPKKNKIGTWVADATMVPCANKAQIKCINGTQVFYLPRGSISIMADYTVPSSNYHTSGIYTNKIVSGTGDYELANGYVLVNVNNTSTRKVMVYLPYQNNDALYSLYQSYQNSFTPNYINNNLLQLTNPKNYLHHPLGPSNIFIIRHGEKNDNNGSKIYYTINFNGIKRSCELPNFINNLGIQGYPISAIITCNPIMTYTTKHIDVSMRPNSTIMLSSWLLNIPMYSYTPSNVSQPYDATTAIKLFTEPYFKGKNILIVFEHKNIQSLTNQIVQCYNYIQNESKLDNLNSDTVFKISTQDWWEKNTPVPKKNQYVGYKPKQNVSTFPVPYIDYSHLLPFWNTHTFDKVYWLSQTNITNSLTFNIFSQNIPTYFKNCNLTIGLIQTELTSKYLNDDNCLPP
jgi:hypothetical protein